MGNLRKRLRSLSGLTSMFGSKKHEVHGDVEEGEEAIIDQTVVCEPGVYAADTHPSPPAMFNQLHNVSIYGGNFVQNNAPKSDRRGFKLLQKRVAASALHNSAQRIEPSRCHPDTRVDILQRIYDWINQPGCRNEYLLWLNGAAGAGKSAIMQTIAERCVQASIAIASFFFIRTDPTRNTISPLVATLAYQLIQAIPETADDVLLTIERNPLIFDQSIESQLQQLIVQPLLSLPLYLQRLFVVFIDGLDECSDRVYQSNLIKILGNVSSGRYIPVVFLIASRREAQLEMEFGQKRVADLLVTLPLDDIQASDDIRRFLNDKFEEIRATHLLRNFLSEDWPTPAVVEQIVEKSSGQFIYASVVINYISSPRTHPAVQLEIINGIRARNPSADNPFAQLDTLYYHIFRQVKDIDTVLDILALNLLTHHDSDVGLRLQRLDALFQLAPGELEVHMADLTAVIRCDRRTRDKAAMKFLHASLPDFLLDKRRSDIYHIDLHKYRTKLLLVFLEMPSPILDPLWPTRGRELISIQVSSRIFAIRTLLKQVKASDRLQHSFMNFSFACYHDLIFHIVYECCIKMLKFLKKLDFKDQGQVYLHVLDVFAAEFAKYWPSDDQSVKRLARWDLPDLLDRINKILESDVYSRDSS